MPGGCPGEAKRRPISIERRANVELQKIEADGSKRFQNGGRVAGGHYLIGDVGNGGTLLIAEGFATAATLHEMTDLPVIVAFNAGNLGTGPRNTGAATQTGRSLSQATTTRGARPSWTTRASPRSTSGG